MFYDSGSGSKMDYATRLAAALSWLMISQKDAVGLVTFNDEVSLRMAPKAYKAYLPQIFAALVHLEPAGGTDISAALHSIAASLNKRSLVILISDLLDEPQEIIKALKHFRIRKHEVLIFHIVDRDEAEFKFKRETQFVDSETGEKIIVTPWQIRKQYLQNYDAHLAELKAGFQQYQIEYNPVHTEVPLNDLLLKYLLKRRKG